MVSRKDSAPKVLTLKKHSLAAAGCDGGKPDLPVCFQQGQAHGNTAIANGTVAFVYPHGTAAGAEVEITGTFQRGRNTLFYNSVQLGQDGGKIPGQGAFQNGHGSNPPCSRSGGISRFSFRLPASVFWQRIFPASWRPRRQLRPAWRAQCPGHRPAHRGRWWNRQR